MGYFYHSRALERAQRLLALLGSSPASVVKTVRAKLYRNQMVTKNFAHSVPTHVWRHLIVPLTRSEKRVATALALL